MVDDLALCFVFTRVAQNYVSRRSAYEHSRSKRPSEIPAACIAARGGIYYIHCMPHIRAHGLKGETLWWYLSCLLEHYTVGCAVAARWQTGHSGEGVFNVLYLRRLTTDRSHDMRIMAQSYGRATLGAISTLLS